MSIRRENGRFSARARAICLALACAAWLGACQQTGPEGESSSAPSARLSNAGSGGSGSSANRAVVGALDDMASSLAEMSSSLDELASSLAEMSSSLAEVFRNQASSAPQSAAETSSGDTSARPEGGSSSAAEASAPEVPDVGDKLAKARKENGDSVAWLQVPNTSISEVVVQGTDNKAYSRRDALGEPVSERVQTNATVLDFECELGSGAAAGMPQNTVIYGVNFGTWSKASRESGWAAFYDTHYRDGEVRYETQADKEEGDRLSAECERLTKDDPDGVRFSQLLRFTDADFARRTPYLYLTTQGDTLIYEVFSVSYTNAYTDPPYNLASYSGANFSEMLRQMREKSIYHYNVEVGDDDKILTLSTDTFKYGGKKDVYGNRAKFVVMARLMQPGDVYHAAATLTENTSPQEPNLHET